MSSATTSASATPTGLAAPSQWDIRGVVNRVASWEDTQYSAKYVLGFNFAYFIYRCARVSATSLLILLCGFTMLAFAVLTRLLGWQADPRSELLTEGHAQRMAETVRRIVNICYGEVKTILYWTNVQKSTIVTLSCFLCLPLVSCLGFSLIGMLALNAYVLHKPLHELYKKHGEKIVNPQIKMAKRKIEDLLKNMPKLQKTITSLANSGKSKKI